MNCFKRLIVVSAGLLAFIGGAAQEIKAVLVDASTSEPVAFATISLTKEGASKAYKYALSGEDGKASIPKVKSGDYVFKAELLGYEAFISKVKVDGKDVDLGEVKMQPDRKMLDAATVSAAGNPIIVKKDTIEFNANSFKTTENDVLEDLLKKLPGVEVGENGAITVNGETIKKITIDGKTFFLDDPQLASKNIPAKIVEKLKVIQKKSEQAEFTGIDDGEEETVIDLSVKPGMLRGAFGNIMAGAGHDVPADNSVGDGDYRYQGAAFIGNFTKERQISLILNGNNTNNRGFDDLSGSMMGNMRGGGMGGGQGGFGGGNGITTSYMGGLNGSWTLFDNKMELGSNYLYNETDKNVEETTDKITYLDDYNMLYHSQGSNNTVSRGNRIGLRVDHKFSENTSILFEPRINFGNGHYAERNVYSTYRDEVADGNLLNSGNSHEYGHNNNVSTSGFALFRQRLGIPGRTLTVMGRYSYSNNKLDAENYSDTYIGGVDSVINQSINSNQRAASLMGRVTYTEPLGNHFYFEANYRYSWNRSFSEKNTIDNKTGLKDYMYSNEITNEYNNQEMGFNFMYQNEKSRAQLGFAAMPTKTYNKTSRYDASAGRYAELDPYKDFRWNFSPRLMVWWEFNENANARVFYRGNSAQPSTRQLMPVPDNTNPLNVSFGNAELTPYFTHSLRGDVRYNNKKTFSSFNIRFNASYTQNPIVSATWYNNGAQFSMPFNGPDNFNAGVNGFANLPIARSNFTISNFTRVNWSQSASYVGTNIDMTTYSEDKDYYRFMNEMIRNFNDEAYFAEHFDESSIKNLGLTERLRLIFRTDNLELSASARTRINKSWYSIKDSRTTTFNNQVRFGVNWTWDATGITFKSEGNYNWYRGYSVEQPNEVVLDAEIQKLLFNKKVTFAIKGYDILGQSKNLSVTDSDNYHREVVNNTLGRYIIASLTYRFGTFDRSKMRNQGRRGPGGGPGGPGGPR